ncbi:hypothetical protein HBB16_13885 [Pseudonocardia sp. MCCB 268]|nr:hypothetical protein [Pseudonocardia cytotoxica]
MQGGGFDDRVPAVTCRDVRRAAELRSDPALRRSPSLDPRHRPPLVAMAGPTLTCATPSPTNHQRSAQSAPCTAVQPTAAQLTAGCATGCGS